MTVSPEFSSPSLPPPPIPVVISHGGRELAIGSVAVDGGGGIDAGRLRAAVARLIGSSPQQISLSLRTSSDGGAVAGGQYVLAALRRRGGRKGRPRRIRVDGRSGTLRRHQEAAEAEDEKRGVCKVCEAAAAAAASEEEEFHWCAYDAVTVGFRSRVGPIQRPSAHSV